MEGYSGPSGLHSGFVGFTLVEDGDLLQYTSDILRIRVWVLFRVCKVKGHATEHMVACGRMILREIIVLMRLLILEEGGRLYTEYTPHSVHEVQCSLFTSTNMQCALVAEVLSCIIFVRQKESVIRSAMSSSCWSRPHLLTPSLPQHEAPPGQHDLLQDDTVHQESLSQAPLPKTTWSESSAKEPLSHINCESGVNPRTNTPTGYEPKEFTTEETATIPMMPSGRHLLFL